MALAEVVTLYDTNAANVADMLRGAAENIESETDADDRTEAIIAVQIAESGRPAPAPLKGRQMKGMAE